MTDLAGKTIGLIGPLAAFPRRLAARELFRRGGYLRRGATRKISIAVVGRRLLDRCAEQEIERRIRRQGNDAALLSENGFLLALGLLDEPEPGCLSAAALSEQSGLSAEGLKLLSLFDAFIRPAEPYCLRDRILAGKYARLISSGVGWWAIARAVHRLGEPGPLTALNLHAQSGGSVHVRFDESWGELDGQIVLPIGGERDNVEELFARAEDAEMRGEYELASALYGRCLAVDPADSVAAYNRANCLRAAGLSGEAAHSYLQALKHDPAFVEAWFNYGDMLRRAGRPEAARRHLLKAIELDGNYADAVYNLAALEFESGQLAPARKWWQRYLELDPDSQWSRTAARAISYIDRAMMGDNAR